MEFCCVTGLQVVKKCNYNYNKWSIACGVDQKVTQVGNNTLQILLVHVKGATNRKSNIHLHNALRMWVIKHQLYAFISGVSYSITGEKESGLNEKVVMVPSNQMHAI